MNLKILLPALGALSSLSAQDARANGAVLARRYQEGEKLVYHMKGLNEDWRYEIQADGVVKKDAAGKFIEEFAWSNLGSDGKPVALPEASLKFRQILSLDPGKPPAVPDLAVVHPMLVGPITDLLTFYVDLGLAIHSGKLARAGDHFYQKFGKPASWADGNQVILGESSIDFDITLSDVDRSSQIATLSIRHVPPAQPTVRLPASWMREPVADTQNNWVLVARQGGKYTAAVGKEVFDVQIKVNLVDGKILSATMENLVETRERDSRDAALADCGDPRPHHILRRIGLSLER